MNCRFCGSKNGSTVLDLGFAPPSNAYLSREALSAPEMYLPLRLFVCEDCWLLQTEDYTKPSVLFQNDYAYLSSASNFWLAHAKKYYSDIKKKLSLNSGSRVVEIASNDGYLLQYFQRDGIPCLGIEPTLVAAQEAEKKGIRCIIDFFGEKLSKNIVASEGTSDLIVANNVLAHVPDINDFVRGMKILLKDGGTVTVEFPHLLMLLASNQFDTVYHEHFSYLSLFVVKRIFETFGLKVFDVEKLLTHGGSLRVYATHLDDPRETKESVFQLEREEKEFGLCSLPIFENMQKKAMKTKIEFLKYLIDKKSSGYNVVGFGAAAKGNTLLNYCGVSTDLISCIFDSAPTKQGRYMPGSHIPIVSPTELIKHRFDEMIIFPWNLSDEISKTVLDIRKAPVKFTTVIPELRTFYG